MTKDEEIELLRTTVLHWQQVANQGIHTELGLRRQILELTRPALTRDQLREKVAHAIAAVHAETHNDFALADAAIAAISRDHVIITKKEYEQINN